MAGIGARRRILLVGDEGVVLYHVAGKSVHKDASISWHVPNFFDQLVDALTEKHVHKPVLILLDVVEQHYRKERLVKLNPLDRQKNLRRRLEVAFPNYSIKAALPLKASKSSKKKDGLPYLFAALPDSEMLETISDALALAQSPIAGLALLPVESASMLTELMKTATPKGEELSRWGILVSQHATGGLRQIITKDGELALTRLTPSTDINMDKETWVKEVVQEFKATLSYLARFGFNQNEGLDLFVICSDEAGAKLKEADLPVSKLHYMSLQQASVKLGYKIPQEEDKQFADPLHAAWAGSKMSLALSMRAPVFQRIMGPRKMARAASAILLVSALAGAGYLLKTGQEYLSLAGEVEEKKQESRMLKVEYDKEIAVFDTLPFDPVLVEKSLAIYNEIDNSSPDYAPFVMRLSDAVGKQIRLSKVSFTHTLEEGLGPETFGAKPEEGAKPGEVNTVLRIEYDPNVDAERAFRETESLKNRLKTAFPDHSVEIITQVENIQPLGQIKDSSGIGQQQSSRRDTRAEISIKGPPL